MPPLRLPLKEIPVPATLNKAKNINCFLKMVNILDMAKSSFMESQ